MIFDELVVGDPQRFIQIMMQLLDNAVKFTDEGSITLIARKVEHEDDSNSCRYLVTVSDTGIGIPEDKQKQIFPFFPSLGYIFHSCLRWSGYWLSVVRKNLWT